MARVYIKDRDGHRLLLHHGSSSGPTSQERVDANYAEVMAALDRYAEQRRPIEEATDG